MKTPTQKTLGVALLLGALWPSCSNDEKAPVNSPGSAGAGGGASAAGTGASAGATTAGSGGTTAATAGGGGGPSNGGSGGSAGTSTDDSICDLACDHAVACLTAGTLCPELSAQDSTAISTACHEICAVLTSDFEALSEHGDRCGLALTAVVDNADLANRPNRDVLERCLPPPQCDAACDTVGVCAANACEDLGAVGSALFSACMDQCSADASFADSVNTAENAGGCPAALDAYEAAHAGTLPAGCAAR